MREATFSAVEYSCALEWWMGDSRSLMFPGSPSRTGLLCLVCTRGSQLSEHNSYSLVSMRTTVYCQGARSAQAPAGNSSMRLVNVCMLLPLSLPLPATQAAATAAHAQRCSQLPSKTAAGAEPQRCSHPAL
jgi:hypothetical protein